MPLPFRWKNVSTHGTLPGARWFGHDEIPPGLSPNGRIRTSAAAARRKDTAHRVRDHLDGQIITGPGDLSRRPRALATNLNYVRRQALAQSRAGP
jgi:hypothetical protein